MSPATLQPLADPSVLGHAEKALFPFHLAPPTGRIRPAWPPRRPASLVERHLAEGRPLVEPAGNLSPGYRAAKRLLDIAGALAIVLVLSPILLATFLVLLVSTRGRPLYWQRRAGYLGRPFWMAKFRTMRLDAERLKAAVANDSDGPVFKSRRDPRITSFGRFLRKTSLDETPQLFHVLAGQMSLVGPRPLDVREVRPLCRLAAAAARRAARTHLPLAGQRPLQRRLHGLGPHGPVVHPQPGLPHRS